MGQHSKPHKSLLQRVRRSLSGQRYEIWTPTAVKPLETVRDYGETVKARVHRERQSGERTWIEDREGRMMG